GEHADDDQHDRAAGMDRERPYSDEHDRDDDQVLLLDAAGGRLCLRFRLDLRFWCRHLRNVAPTRASCLTQLQLRVIGQLDYPGPMLPDEPGSVDACSIDH